MFPIYHNFYCLKRRILSHFRFSCTDFEDHFKSQSFETASPGCVCTDKRAILNISESLNQKVAVYIADYILLLVV